VNKGNSSSDLIPCTFDLLKIVAYFQTPTITFMCDIQILVIIYFLEYKIN